MKNNLEQLLQNYRELISDDKIDDACKLLSDSPYKETGILFNSRYTELIKTNHTGGLERDKYVIDLNTLKTHMLKFINTIQKDIESKRKETDIHKLTPNQEATKFLNNLDKIDFNNLDKEKNDHQCILLANEVVLTYTEDGKIITSDKNKEETSELVSIIKIEDSLNLAYKDTQIVTVRSHLNKFRPVPTTISVQSIALCSLNQQGIDSVLGIIGKEEEKLRNDSTWIEDNKPEDVLQVGDLLMIMNRRVGGWSGTIENPKIELLLAGGSMPTVWDDTEKKLYQLSIKQVLKKEIQEELKFNLQEEDIDVIGGFKNTRSGQLVILCIVYIKNTDIFNIYNGAYKNFEEKIDGVYFGRFEEVLEKYSWEPEIFAGGAEAYPTNFPNNTELMRRVVDNIYNKTMKRIKISEATSISNLLKGHLLDQFYKTKEIVDKAMAVAGFGFDWSIYLKKMDYIAYRLIKSKISEWSENDIYCLCCAIYLHRIGLIDYSDEKTVNIYDNYPLKSKQIVEENSSFLHIESQYVDDISWVIFGHKNTLNQRGAITKKELESKIKGGKLTRQQVSYFLRYSSQLAIMHSNNSAFIKQVPFKNVQPSLLYYDHMCAQIVSNITFTEIAARNKILIKIGDINKGQLVHSLSIIRTHILPLFREKSFSFLGNKLNLEIYESSLAESIHTYFKNEDFISELKEATIKSTKALLSWQNLERENGNWFGWGSEIIINHDGDDTKSFSEPRVVNTTEVLLAISNLEIYDSSDDLVNRVTKIIQSAIPEIENERISMIDPKRIIKYEQKIEELEKKTDKASSKQLHVTKKSYSAEKSYNPFTSLTHKVPTIRVNSIPVFAFCNILENLDQSKLGEIVYSKIQNQLTDCIFWICNTPQSPFEINEGDIFRDHQIFHFILSLKALTRSERYWRKLGIDYIYETKLYSKIKDFVETFPTDKGNWPKITFCAMAIEVLIFYVKKNRDLDHAVIFNEIDQANEHINDIINMLLENIDIKNFRLWKDEKDYIHEEDILDESSEKKTRDWTHITDIWALEGLCQCYFAGLLKEAQVKKIIEIAAVLLDCQLEDGSFFSQTSNMPNQTTKIFIYKTALYIYALNNVYNVLKDYKNSIK